MYFIPLELIKVNYHVHNCRFIYSNSQGETTAPTTAIPLGISIHRDRNHPQHKGYAEYYPLGDPRQCELELSADAPMNQWLISDKYGKGCPSRGPVAYAKTVEDGQSGEYIRVIPQLTFITSTRAFSSGFYVAFR